MTSPHRLLLEVAITSPEDAEVAEKAGADRLELSAALSLGGITPSNAMIREVLDATTLPVFVLIRPRTGGFHYSPREFTIMLNDARSALEAGAAGIVFGFLNADATIDTHRCQEFLRSVGPTQTVFHRAFDFVPSPLQALEELVQLGFQRILTSGQQESALKGATLIRQLIEQAAGRIEILPGAGIKSQYVRAIIEATRCSQVHGSFRGWKRESNVAVDLRLGLGDDSMSMGFAITNAEEVACVRASLDAIADQN